MADNVKRAGNHSHLTEVPRLILVVLIAAGVAYGVARWQFAGDNASNVTMSAAPVTLEQRATVALAAVTIQPVLSGDGRVVPGEGADAWVIEAPVTPADQAYRLLEEPVGVRARILGGPSGFDCAWLDPGVLPEGGVAMRCRIPDEIPVLEGLVATMVVQLEEPTEVTALPVTAVVGAAEQGQVVELLPDGATAVRDVELGVSDIFNIEIVSGLEPDAVVLAAPIQRDFVETSR